jgi:uncharacterized alpha-E superfamily protein
MLSRVAERTYWLARYLERAEDTARLLLVQHLSSLDLPGEARPDWGLLLDVLSAREAFEALPGGVNENNVVRYMFIDRENPSSLVSSLTFARENMRTTREVLPSEAWEQVNSLYLSVARRSTKGLPRSSRHSVLNSVIKSCQQITGMLSGTMSHDEAYQFLRVGRMLERVDMSSRFIDVGTEKLLQGGEETLPYQNVLWSSVLQSLSAYQMYRLRVQSSVTPRNVVEFLLRDRHFPRALVHSLLELEASMQLLPANEKALKAVRSTIRRLRRYRIDISATTAETASLHAFLDDLQADVQVVHKAIDETWFHQEF